MRQSTIGGSTFSYKTLSQSETSVTNLDRRLLSWAPPGSVPWLLWCQRRSAWTLRRRGCSYQLALQSYDLSHGRRKVLARSNWLSSQRAGSPFSATRDSIDTPGCSCSLIVDVLHTLILSAFGESIQLRRETTPLEDRAWLSSSTTWHVDRAARQLSSNPQDEFDQGLVDFALESWLLLPKQS